MKHRRLAGLALAMVVSGAIVGLPAAGAQGAGTADSYGANAGATALDLKVFGTGLTLGLSDASLSSTPEAAGHGLGALTPAGGVTEQTVKATADGQTVGSTDLTCSPLSLPEVPVLSLSTACSSALATIKGGLPTAESVGQVAKVGVGAGGILDQVPLAPVQEQVDQIVGALQPLFDTLQGAGLDVHSVLDDLLTAITDGGDLVSVELGTSVSNVTSTAQTVVAEANAPAATITLLNRDQLPVPLPPVVTIETGSGAAKVVRDRSTGQATPTFDPALVRVTVADDIAKALSLPTNTVQLAPGQTFCLPLPAPLGDSCVVAASGATDKAADGTITAKAAAVQLDLLKGLPNGGVHFALAEATAGVSGAVAQPAAAPAAPATPDAARTLPRTGGGLPVPAGVVAAMLALAAAGYALVRRSSSLSGS
jgi:hypothetical protein